VRQGQRRWRERSGASWRARNACGHEASHRDPAGAPRHRQVAASPGR
jgi:hypothetical protein